MGLIDLPFEILEEIFKNLGGTDLARCRQVCQRFKNVVDGLSDEMWKRCCGMDHWWPQDAKNKSNMSWKELYKSLALWPQIKNATMKVKRFPLHRVNFFKVLNNNKIAVLLNSNGDYVSYLCGYHDTIIYYDLETLTELSLETFGFLFRSYDENKKIITFTKANAQLYAIIKETMTQHLVGTLPSYIFGEYGGYTLCKDSIYFKNESDMLCVSRLIENKGKKTMETEELDELEESVVAFSLYSDSDCINILTDEGNIYCYRNKDFEWLGKIDQWCPDIIYELHLFGFSWSGHVIYKWLTRTFHSKVINVTKLNHSSIYRHDRNILIGTNRKLNIYLNPYSVNGHLILYQSKPDKIINTNKEILQLNVVETVNGHRILLRSIEQLFVYEFIHDNRLRRRKAIAPSLKIKQAKKTNKPKPKHRYMTRSSVTKLRK